MNVLSKLKTDGTFHQRAPLERLHGKRILYSYDLKAATDTLPAVLSGSMLVGLLGDDFGRTWLHMMTATGFRTPDRIRGRKRSNLRGRFDRFTKGQPLGYYSSWPAFTLTHHMLVWKKFIADDGLNDLSPVS
ncbi:hypothetical protein IEQ34_025428 [Dendrobium chrysotoxum]|uniref:Uncharacterized protein n=1 Tax=Dendrobium chrysotoxum TaxID=161865 RepID=A0AAV7FJ05_DENCH|nr:hypothetical protein IEQ34_025428 [Dendrobium chrysotoxum]